MTDSDCFAVDSCTVVVEIVIPDGRTGTHAFDTVRMVTVSPGSCTAAIDGD